jgi:hypothetical protein
MLRFRALFLLACAIPLADAQAPLPHSGKLTYAVEWRLLRAGTATIDLDTPNSAKVLLESAGLVNSLYRVYDQYLVRFDNGYCAASTWMKAEEGKRQRETSVNFDRQRRRASYEERDLLKNTIVKRDEIDTPECVHDIITALLRLRSMNLEPGKSIELPLSDGKKSVRTKVEAQAHEEITTKAGKFQTTRYEVNLFNGNLYARPARVFVWITDDARRIPVQFRVRSGFAIGTINVQLEQNQWS